MALFQKGESGNPEGRKPGSTVQARIRLDIEKELPGVLAAVISQAKAGDMMAARILMDKVCPNIKPQALPVTVPVGDTLDGTGNNILSNTLQGQLPPDIGALLITAIANQSKIVEISDLAKRIEALEGKSEHQG